MDVAKPPIPKPPNISKLRTSNTRVYFDCNCTPYLLKHDEDEWYQLTQAAYYMHTLGFDHMQMVYNGTINWATTWSQGGVPFDVPYVNDRFQLDAARQGNWSDWEETPDPIYSEQQFFNSVRALRMLAEQPNRYGGLAKPRSPSAIDIEGTTTLNRHPANFRELLTRAKKWQRVLVAFRGNNFSHWDNLYAYGYWEWFTAQYWDGHKPTMQSLDWEEFCEVEHANHRMLNGAMIPFYMWPPTIANPSLWFQEVMKAETLIKRYYPAWWPNRIAVIRPQQDDGNTLVSMDLWQTQIEFLVDRGWHLLLWWNPYAAFAPAKRYIEHVARYHKG